MSAVHVVVPEGIDDPALPSGGNVYDRRVCCGLSDLGWSVVEHPVSGTRLPEVLAGIPSGAVVLLDGLVGSTAPDVLLPEAGRLRLVMLVHLPLGDEQECAALSATRAVITTSEWSRNRLLELYAMDRERVYVAAPGTDEADLSLASATGGELVCVAAVIPGKGHDVLLAALAEVADRSWRLTCVGSLTRDPDHVEVLQRRARDAGIADRVCFTGPLARDALSERYAAADVLVLASRTESYGMVVTEALARGLPVISTSVGGLPESLGGQGGLLVEPDDVDALAEALRGWLDDAGLRARLRENAEERRAGLSRWPATVDRVARVLTEVAR